MSISSLTDSANMKLTKIIIDSDDRTSGTNTNFTYNLGTTIENIRLINIRGIEFENLLYNINDYQNSLIFVSPLGVTSNIILTNSIYSITRLSLALENELNAVADGNTVFKVNFDDYEKITISSVKGITPFSLNFTGATAIGDVLGIDANEYVGITSLTGNNPINLSYTKNLFIGSTTLGENKFDEFIVSNGASNVIKHVDVRNNFGDILHDDEQTNINLRKEIPALTSIDIKIVDDRNRLAQLNNASIVISLDIYSRIYNNSFSI